MRRVARARREARLEAAAACFEADGFTVPLEDIAARAGVGRGTLYRNFKDRLDLAFAIFERQIDRFEEAFDPTLPIAQLLPLLVREGLPSWHLFTRLRLDMRLSRVNLSAFTALGDRLERLFAPAVTRAIAAGELRPDATPRQVMTAMRMISGFLVDQQMNAEVEAEIAEALDLLLHGLMPRSHSSPEGEGRPAKLVVQ
jgi:AcrR family transcriptional regulator